MLGYVSQMQAVDPANPQAVNAVPNFIPLTHSTPPVPPQEPTTTAPIQETDQAPQETTPPNSSIQPLNDCNEDLIDQPPVNKCIRAGCQNDAIIHSEWEDEYCSNECVVTHCKDVFNAWLASNRQNSTVT